MQAEQVARYYVLDMEVVYKMGRRTPAAHARVMLVTPGAVHSAKSSHVLGKRCAVVTASATALLLNVRVRGDGKETLVIFLTVLVSLLAMIAAFAVRQMILRVALTVKSDGWA